MEEVPAGAGDAAPPAPITTQQADGAQHGPVVEEADWKQGGGRKGRRAQENRQTTRGLLLLQGTPLGVGELVGDDHDEVDEGPDAAAAQGEELRDADADVSGVEAVDAEASQEEAQQQGDQPVLGRIRAGLHRGWGRN